MDPFWWGFVRGGAMVNAIGCPLLAAYAAYAGHLAVAYVFAVCAIVAVVLFLVNEQRRPW